MVEEEKTTTMVLPISIRDKLFELKKDKGEPLWRVVERLLGEEAE